MGNVADEAVKAEKNGAWVKKTQVIYDEHVKELKHFIKSRKYNCKSYKALEKLKSNKEVGPRVKALLAWLDAQRMTSEKLKKVDHELTDIEGQWSRRARALAVSRCFCSILAVPVLAVPVYVRLF